MRNSKNKRKVKGIMAEETKEQKDYSRKQEKHKKKHKRKKFF